MAPRHRRHRSAPACCAPLVATHSGIRWRAAAAASGGKIAMQARRLSVGSSPSWPRAPRSGRSAVSFEAAPSTHARDGGTAGECGRIDLADPMTGASSCSRNPGLWPSGLAISAIGSGAAPSPLSCGKCAVGVGDRRAPPEDRGRPRPAAHDPGAGSIEPGNRQLDAPILAGAQRKMAGARPGASPPFGNRPECTIHSGFGSGSTAMSRPPGASSRAAPTMPRSSRSRAQRRASRELYRTGRHRESRPFRPQHAALAPGVAETMNPSRAARSASVQVAT